MKNCPECAEKIADDAVHCGHCGARVEEEKDNNKTMFGMGAISADDLDDAVDEAKQQADGSDGGETQGEPEGGQEEKKGGMRLPTPGEMADKDKQKEGNGAPSEDVRNRPRTDTSPKTLKGSDEGVSEEAFAKTEAMPAMDEDDLDAGEGDADLDEALADLESGRLDGPADDQQEESVEAGPNLGEDASPTDLGGSPFSEESRDRPAGGDEPQVEVGSEPEIGAGDRTVQAEQPPEAQRPAAAGSSTGGQQEDQQEDSFQASFTAASESEEPTPEDDENTAAGVGSPDFDETFGAESGEPSPQAGQPSDGPLDDDVDPSFGAEPKAQASAQQQGDAQQSSPQSGQQSGGASESPLAGGSQAGQGGGESPLKQDSRFGGGQQDQQDQQQQGSPLGNAGGVAEPSQPAQQGQQAGGAPVQQGQQGQQAQQAAGGGEDEGIPKKYLIIGGIVVAVGGLGCSGVALAVVMGWI